MFFKQAALKGKRKTEAILRPFVIEGGPLFAWRSKDTKSKTEAFLGGPTSKKTQPAHLGRLEPNSFPCDVPFGNSLILV